jgi:hypothetical protein
MSYINWTEIYGDYSDDQLAEEIAKLKKQVDAYTSQSVGGKSYTKDVRLVQDQLQGAIRVKNSRRGTESFTGIADFSKGIDGSAPNQTGTSYN